MHLFGVFSGPLKLLPLLVFVVFHFVSSLQKQALNHQKPHRTLPLFLCCLVWVDVLWLFFVFVVLINPVHLCRCLATELQKRAFATLHPCEQDLISTLVKADFPELVDIVIHRTLNLAHVVVLEKLFGWSFAVRIVKYLDPWANPACQSLLAPKLLLVATCVFDGFKDEKKILKCCTSSHLKVLRHIFVHLCFVEIAHCRWKSNRKVNSLRM